MIRRAQWFLMSLPIFRSFVERERERARGGGGGGVVQKEGFERVGLLGLFDYDMRLLLLLQHHRNIRCYR